MWKGTAWQRRIEHAWLRRSADFDPKGIAAFRRLHDRGANYVVATDVPEPYEQRYKDVKIRFLDLSTLVGEVC